MHQPQYRDPATRPLRPALDAPARAEGLLGHGARSWRNFREVHATFNVVPSLAAQIEEYASGKFKEPWFELAFMPAERFTPRSASAKFCCAHFRSITIHLMRALAAVRGVVRRVQSSGRERAAAQFGVRDWRDLQVLSQLAWMDEEYLAHDPVVSRAIGQGQDFTESDKDRPCARSRWSCSGASCRNIDSAAERGQIEISTTPFYHPILPLLCDTDIARASNPHTPLPHPPFRHPEDAREQLGARPRISRAAFGKAPAGLWPSEGSVSDQALLIAAEMGFRWFATDEGVLGRSARIWDLGATRAAFRRMPNRCTRRGGSAIGGNEIAGFFRDHYLSDLIGFVYSRMDARSGRGGFSSPGAAIGERVAAAEAADAGGDSGRRECLGILRRERTRIPAPLLRRGCGTIRTSMR